MKAALLTLLLLVTSVGFSQNKRQSTAEDRRFETCRAKLKAAQKLDVLYDLRWNGRTEPKVYVGPTFFSMPVDAKEGFAETVNCFLMAGKQGGINFDLLSWRTGKRVARWSYLRLIVD